MKVKSYIYYEEIHEKCLEINLDIDLAEGDKWITTSGRTIVGYIEDKGYEALEKLYEDEEEFRYRIDDVGYEPFAEEEP